MLSYSLAKKLRDKIADGKIFWEDADDCDVGCLSLAQLIDIYIKNTQSETKVFRLEYYLYKKSKDKIGRWGVYDNWSYGDGVHGTTPENTVAKLILEKL
ncbi:MAG: hypothetical protein WD512_00605 [Candidatus Paceibacterota bacterium]